MLYDFRGPSFPFVSSFVSKSSVQDPCCKVCASSSSSLDVRQMGWHLLKVSALFVNNDPEREEEVQRAVSGALVLFLVGGGRGIRTVTTPRRRREKLVWPIAKQSAHLKELYTSAIVVIWGR